MSALDLFLHDQYVGHVKQYGRDRKRVYLVVDNDYAERIKLSESFMTIAGRSAQIDALSTFLGGYLPEGNQRVSMAATRHIGDDDLFALLREFGGSVAGAVTLRTQDEPANFTPAYEELDEGRLTYLLLQAIADGDQGIADDSRSTLPGYQPKFLAAKFDDHWFQPHGRAHSTHILKPQVPGRHERIYDEHYGHQLAVAVGLASYETSIVEANNITYLAIERFDRAVSGRHVDVIHQEDLAQVMGLDWYRADVKFQDPQRPSNPDRASAKTIAEALSRTTGGVTAVETWLRHLTFHVTIGNNDAHAKNVSLVHKSDGASVAQIYDAVPNLFQEGRIQWNMALAIDNTFNHQEISVERLLNEAASWQLISRERAERAITETIDLVASAVETIKPMTGTSEDLNEAISWSTNRLQRGLVIGDRHESTTRTRSRPLAGFEKSDLTVHLTQGNERPSSR